MRDEYTIDVEFIDKYQIRNNNDVANFIVHSLREDGIDEFDSEYLYDNTVFSVRFSSASSKICENIKHKLLNCFIHSASIHNSRIFARSNSPFINNPGPIFPPQGRKIIIVTNWHKIK